MLACLDDWLICIECSVWDLSHNYISYWNLIASCSLIMCFFRFARILHLQTCDDLFNICLSVTFATCASELFCRNCFQIKVQPSLLLWPFLRFTHANIDRRSVIFEANIWPQNLSQIFEANIWVLSCLQERPKLSCLVKVSLETVQIRF